MFTSKILKVVLVLLLISICGCAKEYKWEEMDILKDTQIEQIDKISFGFDTEGGRFTKEIESSKEIKQIYNLLCQVNIVEPSNIAYEDAGMDICVHIGNDTIIFIFENDVLVIDKQRYLVNNIKPLRAYLYGLLQD